MLELRDGGCVGLVRELGCARGWGMIHSGLGSREGGRQDLGFLKKGHWARQRVSRSHAGHVGSDQRTLSFSGIVKGFRFHSKSSGKRVHTF